MNGGWTNTARTQKLLRFNIRLSASVSMVPDADKNFDISSLGLSSTIKATGNPITPTFGGATGTGAGITVTDPAHPNDPNYQYKTNMPGGVVSYIPAPQIQLTVGLIKNADVTLRLIPTTQITSDVGSVGMFGVGIKHNFTNDLGTAGKALPFDLALAVGYTHLTYSKPLNVTPDANHGTLTGSQDYSNQSMQGDFSGWNAQVILSKKLLFFTPFVSVGYMSSKTDVGLKGNFPFVTGVTPPTIGSPTAKPNYTTYANPININSSDAGVSGPRADIGFQLSLFVLKIFGSYSFAQYQSANAGIGLGF